jgi:hypothetical protein
MTINWDKIKNILRWKNIKRACFDFLEKKVSWILFTLIFALSVYGAYLWYGYVYHPGWSEERKGEYRNEKGKGTDLNKNKFDQALENYNLRGDNFNKKIENQKDIFRLGKTE